jgi:hypothetical protein
MSTEIDADTGQELISFIRRKQFFLYLRDSETKRFIKRLREFTLSYIASLEYESTTKSYKNVYIDIKISTTLEDIQFQNRKELEQNLPIVALEDLINEFGSDLVNSLEFVSEGYEYHTIEKSLKYPNAELKKIWAHRDRRLQKESTRIVML